MLGHHFRHDMIKKHVAMFGALFNDIQIERHDSVDDVWHKIKVPLTIGPRDKLIAAANKEFGSKEQAVATAASPRISFEMENMSRDTQRQTNPRDKVRRKNEKHMYKEIPYNFTFNVYVAAKTQTDGNRIVEQVLAFFTPSITITMFPFPEDHSVSKDLKVTLNGLSCEDQYEGDVATRRSIVWTLQFTMQGFLYGPVYDGGIIKRIEMNFRPEDGSAHPIIEAMTISPGLTTEGLPTTDPAQAIPFDEVKSTDNWAFLEQYESGS